MSKSRKPPKYVRFTHIWPHEGFGKYWKRKLNKARRKYAKDLLKFGRGKEPVDLESEVNWKLW